MDTVLRGRSATVTIGADKPFCIIGERINPTGRKKLAEELKGGDFSTVVLDTQTQVEAGADMLDVNAGIPLVDEAELLAPLLQTVQAEADVLGKENLATRETVGAAPAYALSDFLGQFLAKNRALLGAPKKDEVDELLP